MEAIHVEQAMKVVTHGTNNTIREVCKALVIAKKEWDMLSKETIILASNVSESRQMILQQNTN
jgi:hypothetical protein